MTTISLPSLNTGNDARGHVLLEIVSDQMDANNDLDDQGHGSPQPNQSHLVGIGAARGHCIGVKGTFG